MDTLETLRYLEILSINNRLINNVFINHECGYYVAHPQANRDTLDSMMGELPDLDLVTVFVNSQRVHYQLRLKCPLDKSIHI